MLNRLFHSSLFPFVSDLLCCSYLFLCFLFSYSLSQSKLCPLPYTDKYSLWLLKSLLNLHSTVGMFELFISGGHVFKEVGIAPGLFLSRK